MESASGEVTRLLQEVRNGQEGAEERLIALVYKELRRLAASYMRKESPDHSLQPTALVHEAYIRITRSEQIDWQSRSHFFGVAARVMRNILVDHARARQAEKRGQGWTVVGLDEAFVASPMRPVEFIALDDALNRLAVLSARQGQVVDMRFFADLNHDEIAAVLGVSSQTVKRDLRSAKAWLFKELRPKSLKKGLPNHNGVHSTP